MNKVIFIMGQTATTRANMAQSAAPKYQSTSSSSPSSSSSGSSSSGTSSPTVGTMSQSSWAALTPEARVSEGYSPTSYSLSTQSSSPTGTSSAYNQPSTSTIPTIRTTASGLTAYSTPSAAMQPNYLNSDALSTATLTGVGVSQYNYYTEASNQYIRQQAAQAGINTAGMSNTQIVQALNRQVGGSNQVQNFKYIPSPIRAGADIVSPTTGEVTYSKGATIFEPGIGQYTSNLTPSTSGNIGMNLNGRQLNLPNLSPGALSNILNPYTSALREQGSLIGETTRTGIVAGAVGTTLVGAGTSALFTSVAGATAQGVSWTGIRTGIFEGFKGIFTAKGAIGTGVSFGLPEAFKFAGGKIEYATATPEQKEFMKSERYTAGISTYLQTTANIRSGLGPFSWATAFIPGQPTEMFGPIFKTESTKALTKVGYSAAEIQTIRRGVTYRQAEEVLTVGTGIGALGEIFGKTSIIKGVSPTGTFLGTTIPKAFQTAYKFSLPAITTAGAIEGMGVEYSQQRIYGAPYSQGPLMNTAMILGSGVIGGVGAGLIGGSIAARSTLASRSEATSALVSAEGKAYIADLGEKMGDWSADLYMKGFSKISGRTSPEIFVSKTAQGYFFTRTPTGTPVNVRTPTFTPTFIPTMSSPTFTTTLPSTATIPSITLSLTSTTPTTVPSLVTVPTTTPTTVPTTTTTTVPTTTTTPAITTTTIPITTTTTIPTFVPTFTPTTTPTSTPTTVPVTVITPQLPPFALFPMPAVELGGRRGIFTGLGGMFSRYIPSLRGIETGKREKSSLAKLSTQMFAGTEIRGLPKDIFGVGNMFKKTKRRRR